MKTYISLLRGINVSGQKKIRMEELRSLYESLDLGSVRTYLQSGNVVFESQVDDEAALASLIETKIQGFYGYSVPVFIREVDDFKRIVVENPFLIARNEDTARLYVTFLSRIPSEMEIRRLSNPGIAGEEYSLGQREIFLFIPKGYGTTKLSNNFFEKKLDLFATTRNWNTVNALFNLAAGAIE